MGKFYGLIFFDVIVRYLFSGLSFTHIFLAEQGYNLSLSRFIEIYAKLLNGLNNSYNIFK